MCARENFWSSLLQFCETNLVEWTIPEVPFGIKHRNSFYVPDKVQCFEQTESENYIRCSTIWAELNINTVHNFLHLSMGQYLPSSFESDFCWLACVQCLSPSDVSILEYFCFQCAIAGLSLL